MCSAIALVPSVFPKHLFEEHDLFTRVFDRGGNNPEVRFAFTDPVPLLPVMIGGVLKLVQWGSRSRQGPLPTTGWTWRTSVESGAWAGLGCETEPVLILATYGCEKNTWFRIREGIHGLLVTPPSGPPCAYMICDHPTRYFRVLTVGADRTPWLVNEVI
ncbi:hypothetical protein [Zavarzinella formosa]|uniref:hypothetical protein n=1 Tax=Zavarzinella formosa TaxID=360055 RepID=UPI0002E30C82|nr:hypothetical protein [Zavarzinella formosa]